MSALHSFTLYGLLTAPGSRLTYRQDEKLYADRQRRETARKVGGAVEFVHPDLKDELSKQDEDPNNPWVWLTSYSRIPVGQTDQSCLVLSS